MNNGNQHCKELEIHFEITSQCGLNCIHCSSGSGMKQPTQQLCPEKIKDFIKSISKDVILYVCLTGGEPLLSSQFFPILNTLTKFSNIDQIGLFTSGCIIAEKGGIQPINEELSMTLRKAGITFCYLSIYSHLDNIHDLVTRVPGSYECSIRSMRNLLDNGIETKANFVPMKCNKKEIEETVHFLNDMEVREFRFLRLVEHGRARTYWGSIGLSRDEQEAMLKKVIESVTKDELKTKITAAGFPEILDCRPFGTGRMCQAGIGLYYIDWQGNVFPCACEKRQEAFSLCNVDDADVSKKLLSSQKPHNIRPHNIECLQDTQKQFSKLG